MQRKRLFVRALAPVALILLGALTWFAIKPGQQPPTTQRLPDGSVVTIKAVYGRKLTIAQGNFWQKIAGRILPHPVAKRLGIPHIPLNFLRDGTYIVVETFSTNANFRGFGGGGRPTLIVQTADDVGNKFTWNQIVSFYPLSSNSLVEVFRVPLVSHQATQIKLTIIQNDLSSSTVKHQIAEFVLSNPAPHYRSRWSAGHLPMTNEAGGLTTVLSAIDQTRGTIRSFSGVERIAAPFHLGTVSMTEPVSSPRLLLFEQGVPTTYWSLAACTVQDEEGNISRPISYSKLSGYFSPLETRKWHFKLQHIFPSDPEDVVRVLVTISAEDKGGFVPTTTNYHSYQITIDELSEGHIKCTFRPPFTDLSTKVTIAYADDQGKQQTPLDEIAVGPAGAHIGFGPGIPKNIKSANVIFTFARTTNHFVEFLAHPEPLTANAPVKN